MNKVYYVIIKGRTLESRNLKELLSRAVSAKRIMDRSFHSGPQFHGNSSVENSMRSYEAGGTAVSV